MEHSDTQQQLQQQQSQQHGAYGLSQIQVEALGDDQHPGHSDAVVALAEAVNASTRCAQG